MPPDPVAVKVTATLGLPVVGPAMVTAKVNGLMTMLAEAVAVLAFESVTVTETVKVPFAL